MAISKRAMVLMGILTVGLIAAGANAYGTIDMNWLMGNAIFFLTFGFVVFWVFGGFKRQKDSEMRQNWTETRRYKDQGTCPKCGSTDITFDLQDARNQMIFVKCQECGHEWLFTMPQPG